MTNDNNIKRIIQLYFGKHFSRSGRVLFGRWLRAEGGASEKSDMLQAFWEHLPAEATAETREDWDALQRHLQVEPVRRNTVPMYRGWIKYAAVIALMLLTGAATFFVRPPTTCPACRDGRVVCSLWREPAGHFAGWFAGMGRCRFTARLPERLYGYGNPYGLPDWRSVVHGSEKHGKTFYCEDDLSGRAGFGYGIYSSFLSS